MIPNKESLRRHWKIILIFILALTPLRWFKQDFLIAKGDAFPFIEPLINFHRFSYTWLEFGTGSISQTPSYIIWMGIWYVLDVLRLPINVIQIILEALYFLGTGLSMYFLALTLYRNQSITPFVASVFYMFNFFMILRTLNSAVSWTLVFLPIMLAFYIRIVDNLKNNRKTTKNVIGFAVTSTILLSFASVNPPLLALIVVAFFILFAYYFTSEGNLRFELIKNLVFLSFVSILLNIWWIVSFLVYVSPSGAMRVGTVIDVVAWSWTHRRASFLNLFWLNGFWAWSRTYFPYFDAYSSPFMRFIVFIPMIVGFSALLFKNEYRKINSYFGIIIVLLIFLAKGLHPPFEDINLFFYKYVPGFFLFREPFGKFYIILIIFLALLIGSSCNAIVEFIKNTRISHRAVISSIFIGFIITSFLVQTFPLLTGEVITSLTQFSPYIQIPNYWDRMSDYINSKDEDFKILLTPDTSSYVGYDWGYYGIDELASRLITKPVLKHPYGYLVNSNYEKIIMAVYEKIKTNQTEDLVKLLSLLNVKYILQRNDVIVGKLVSPEQIKFFLSNQECIMPETSIGQLDLYRISDEYFLPHIYPATTLFLVNDSINEMFQVATPTYLSNNAIFLSNQTREEQWDFLESYNEKYGNGLADNKKIPHISFKKINPTKYQIKIENASQPFFLIFLETYDPRWKAYAEDRDIKFNEIVASYDNVNVHEAKHEMIFTPEDIFYLFAKSLPDNVHFITNGYANAWYIDPKEIDKDGDGNFTITLYFLPQSLFYLGLFISGITFLVCIAYLLYGYKIRFNEFFKTIL